MRKMKTVMSTRGQLTLPKAVRDSLRWGSGTRLSVEQTSEGVLLKAERAFPETSLDDVVGSIPYDGPPVSIEQMHEAIATEAKRRHARGRY